MLESCQALSVLFASFSPVVVLMFSWVISLDM
jgi:hypothetical protein